MRVSIFSVAAAHTVNRYARAHVLDVGSDTSFLAFLRAHGVTEIATLLDERSVTICWNDTAQRVDVSDFPSFVPPWKLAR